MHADVGGGAVGKRAPAAAAPEELSPPGGTTAPEEATPPGGTGPPSDATPPGGTGPDGNPAPPRETTAPDQASPLHHRFRRHLDRHPSLVPPGATVLIAVSGGPDSMALLYLLREVAGERGLRLLAAHFDHGARPGSAEEAERVAEWVAEAGIACSVERAPAGLRPTQAAFRRARYRFLRDVAEEIGAERIATGHQADDQAETVVLRVLRGTGIRGLAGIPARRGPYVRPLLPFWRAEILPWLQERGIPWLEDPSNADRRWARARVRHDVIPAMERAAGRPVRPGLVALAASARRADRALAVAAEMVLDACRIEAPEESPGGPPGGSPEGPPEGSPARVRLARDELRSYDPELQARAIRLLARRFGKTPTRGGTRSAVEFIKRGRSGTGVEVAEGLWLQREFDALWFGRPPEREPDQELRIESPSPGICTVSIGGRRYRVEWGGDVGDGHRWSLSLSLRPADFPLTLRGPRPGDRIRLDRGTRKLKRLFNERRVPRSERGRRPVLETASGRVVWVPGIGTEAEDEAGADRGAESVSDAERIEIGISDA